MRRLFATMFFATLLGAIQSDGGPVPAALAQSPAAGGAAAPPSPPSTGAPAVVSSKDQVEARLAGIGTLLEAVAQTRARVNEVLADRPDPPLLSDTPFEKAQYRDRDVAWRASLNKMSDELAALQRQIAVAQGELRSLQGEAAFKDAAGVAEVRRDLGLAEHDVASWQRDIETALRETR